VTLFKNRLKKWQDNDEGNVMIESVLVLPIMLTMMLGIIDIGTGLMVNKKLITSSQIISDLLARRDSVNSADVADAMEAGQLVMFPYDLMDFGIDIAGIRFDGVGATPLVEWRETDNMAPNVSVLAGSDGLGTEDEGVIAVTVSYSYVPRFSSFAVNPILMEEVAYVRGRGSPFVAFQ